MHRPEGGGGDMHRPEGAATCQPRAERSAALGYCDHKHSALKGRYNGNVRLKPD